MVGFLGTIFSERLIAGTKRICCNTTSWFVEDKYRAQMLPLRLFAPILRMKDLLITNLSPTDRAGEICKGMGYKFLDQEQIVVPVIPGLASMLGIGRRNIVISFEQSEIQPHLNLEERQIFADHRNLPCRHFLIKERTGEYCYGIATSNPMARFRHLQGNWLNLCYLSQSAVFARNFPLIKKALWAEGRFFVLRYDARFFSTKLSQIAVRRNKIRQYKSKEAVSAPIDNIYSELVTFNKY
jgi:hypothetical protein